MIESSREIMELIVITLSLCCLSLPAPIQSDEWENSALWTTTFNDIFGPDREGLLLMSGRQIMRSIDFLARDDISDSIDDDRRNVAEYWHARLSSFYPSNCNVEYLREVSEEYERQNTGSNPNFEKLHLTFRKNLIEYCSSTLSNLPSIVTADHQSRLTTLWYIYSVKSSVNNASALVNALTKPVLQLIETSPKSSGQDVMTAWNNAPCAILLSTLQRPEAKLYSDFVQMCQSESRSLIEYYPEPIRQWVDIIDMCKHVETLMPSIIEGLHKGNSYARESWKRAYEQIFGAIAHNAIAMSESQLYRSIMLLHSTAHRFAPIDGIKMKIIDTWYFALIDHDIEHCSTVYVEEMSESHKEQNINNNKNFKQLFSLVVKSLKEYCTERFSDLPIKLARLHLPETILNVLRPAMRSVGRFQLPEQDLATVLTDPIIKSIASGKTGTETKQVWAEGPCRKVLSALQEHDSAFIDMTRHIAKEYHEHCSEPIDTWTRFVGMCKLLDRALPTLADSQLSAFDVRQSLELAISAITRSPASLNFG